MGKKIRSRDEFRTNNAKKEKHPAYIFAQIGDDYRFVGITHADITDGIKNIPLEKNPNPKDSRKAYMRPFSGRQNRGSFGSKKKGWRMSEKDKKKIPK